MANSKYWYAVCEIATDDRPQDWDTGAETLNDAIQMANAMIEDGTDVEIVCVEIDGHGSADYDATYRRDDDGDWVKIDPVDVWQF